jgi:HK97 family phage major capsid protein
MDEVKLKEMLTALEAREAKSVADAEAIRAETKSLREDLDAVRKESAAYKEQAEELAEKIKMPAWLKEDQKAAENLGNAEYKAVFDKYFKTGEGEHAVKQKAADLRISTDAQGGYALPEDLRRNIIMLEHDLSPLRQEAAVVDAGTTDIKQLISVGKANSGWVGETDARPQTDSPELAQRLAYFGEVYATPAIYQHMLEDAFYNVESWLSGEVSREFQETEGVAFLEGDAASKPIGITNGLGFASAAANDVTGVYRVLSSGVASALGADEVAIIKLLRSAVKSIKRGYRKGAKFMMNETTHSVLEDLVDANGRHYMQPDITDEGSYKLFGYPVVINEDMDDIGANTHPVIFGNFKRAYQIIDRVGMSTLRDPYSVKGAVSFYTRKRVGSMKLDVSALTVVATPAA